ncbi:MAG: FABP family protein [Cyclobacteriaceae bacterium]|nr:FABP family protein [Cyclobacteriaceae bacterium]
MNETLMQRIFGFLEGEWRGEGEGMFPTIDNFRYVEHLRFSVDEERPFCHLEQRTWIKPSAKPSHWESGFLSFEENMTGSLRTVQSGGRSEVILLEEAIATDEKIELKFSPSTISHDFRIVGTSRQWILNLVNASFSYEMQMATQNVTKLQLHLRATLSKVGGNKS